VFGGPPNLNTWSEGFGPKDQESGSAWSLETADGHPGLPSIPPPGGGGATRGIGQKFAANPATPSGNGSYGFGVESRFLPLHGKLIRIYLDIRMLMNRMSLSSPSAEDLVPVFKTNPITGDYVNDVNDNFVYDEFPRDCYLVRRHHPRIEGLFARTARWTGQSDGEFYWRSISTENVTTFCGKVLPFPGGVH
jgi:hypothetical protein